MFNFCAAEKRKTKVVLQELIVYIILFSFLSFFKQSRWKENKNQFAFDLTSKKQKENLILAKCFLFI